MRELIRFFLMFCLIVWSLPVIVAADRPRFDWVHGDREPVKPGLGLAVPEIVWDGEQLSQATQAVSEAVAASLVDKPDLHIVQLTSPLCGKCPAGWQALQVALVRNGWTFGPGKWFRQETVPFDRPLPAYQLRNGATVLKEFDATVKPVTLAEVLSEAVTRPAPAAARRERPASAFTVGTVKARGEVAALLATFRPLLGNGGKLSLTYNRSGGEVVFVAAGLRVQIPPQTQIDWTLVGDALQISFSKPIVFSPVNWPTSFQINGLRVAEDSAVVQMPWMIDMRVRVE